MNDPVSRIMLLFDIERYSDRDDVEQAYLRRMLYDVADRTLAAAGIEETARRRADRGDGLIELIDAGNSLTTLLRALLQETPVLLRSVNRMASSSAQMRLRATLATGYVAVDEVDGWVGSDLNHAARLLDSDELRASLRASSDDFALCVSTGVHDGIVRHGHPGIPPEDFVRIAPASKNGRLDAWLYDAADPAGTTRSAGGDTGSRPEQPSKPAEQSGSAPAAAAGGASFTFHGNPSFGGDLVGGDQRILEGGTVEGDFVIGRRQPDGEDRR